MEWNRDRSVSIYTEICGSVVVTELLNQSDSNSSCKHQEEGSNDERCCPIFVNCKKNTRAVPSEAQLIWLSLWLKIEICTFFFSFFSFSFFPSLSSCTNTARSFASASNVCVENERLRLLVSLNCRALFILLFHCCTVWMTAQMQNQRLKQHAVSLKPQSRMWLPWLNMKAQNRKCTTGFCSADFPIRATTITGEVS